MGEMNFEEEYMTPEDYNIARKNGISYKIAYERFHNSLWSKQRTITEEVKKKPIWETYKEQALENGVSYQVFRKRIRCGETPEMAVSRGKDNKPDILTEEWYLKAESLGIKRGTMKHRVHRLKMTPEQAIDWRAGENDL